MKNLFLFLLKCKNLFFKLAFRCIYVGQYTTNRNFGDGLNLILLKKIFASKNIKIIPYRHSFPYLFRKGINLHFIGSTLGEADKNSIIWGAGAVSNDVTLKENPKRVLSVRGPLTRQLLLHQNIACPEIYGDPALLLPKFYNPSIENKHNIGFIPHYIDQSKLLVKRLQSDEKVYYINILLSRSFLKPSVYTEWINFVNEVCSCEVILSSSLHGLIVGDAYKKRTLWLKFGNDVIGNDFKFYDYYSSMGIKPSNVNPVNLIDNYITPDVLYKMASKKPVENIDMELFLKQDPW